MTVGRVTDAGFGRYVHKALPFHVAEEDVFAPVDHVEVGPAVVVVINEGGPATVGVGQGHLVGVGGAAEGTVAVVAEEDVGAVGVGDVEVLPTVAVVVAPGEADGPVIALAGVDQPGGPADVLEEGVGWG